MKALISDIHSNFDALCAVCADIKKQNVDEVICLGDIVGYGAEPEACVDMVMQKARVTILGNHDFALVNGPIGFNSIAADVIRAQRTLMEPEKKEKKRKTEDYYPCACEGNSPACMIRLNTKNERWNFLSSLPTTYTDDFAQYIHGSPQDPTFDYVFPDKFLLSWQPTRIGELISSIDKIAFCGHTHVPVAISADTVCHYPDPKSDFTMQLEPKTKYLINIGSVGQPRDLDSRACYLLYNENSATIQWRRVEYDVASAVKKIEAQCGENNFCASRLLVGR